MQCRVCLVQRLELATLALRFLVQARILKRQRSALRHRREQPSLAIRKHAGVRVAERKAAERVPANPNWVANPGAYPFAYAGAAQSCADARVGRGIFDLNDVTR